MYRQKLHSVQLTVTFDFSIDFEEESIHVFLSRSSWTIFCACQVCGLKPSFRRSSQGQRIFITWQNTPSTVAPEIPRIPPLNNRPSFWYWYTQKHKGKPSTRACSSWHHTASLDNRSGVTRDPRRTGLPMKMVKYTRRGPAASHWTKCSSWTLRDLPLPCLPAAPPGTSFQTRHASPNEFLWYYISGGGKITIIHRPISRQPAHESQFSWQIARYNTVFMANHLAGWYRHKHSPQLSSSCARFIPDLRTEDVYLTLYWWYISPYLAILR